MNGNRILQAFLIIVCLLSAVPANGMRRLPKLARMACEMALKLPASAIYTPPINTCPSDERKRSFTTMATLTPGQACFGPLCGNRCFSSISYAKARAKLGILVDEILHPQSFTATARQQIVTIIKSLDDYDRLTRPEEEVLENWLGAKGYGKEIDYVQDATFVFNQMMKNPAYADAVRQNLSLRVQNGGKPFFDWMVTCWYSPKFAIELTQTAITKLATSFEKDKNKLTNDTVMVQHLLQALLSLDPETMAVKKCLGFECFMPSDNLYPNEYRDDQARYATIRVCLILLQKGITKVLKQFEQDFQALEEAFIQEFLEHYEKNSQQLPNEWGQFAQSITTHRASIKALHREQYEQKFNTVSSLQDIYLACAMALELLPAASA